MDADGFQKLVILSGNIDLTQDLRLVPSLKQLFVLSVLFAVNFRVNSWFQKGVKYEIQNCNFDHNVIPNFAFFTKESRNSKNGNQKREL